MSAIQHWPKNGTGTGNSESEIQDHYLSIFVESFDTLDWNIIIFEFLLTLVNQLVLEYGNEVCFSNS